MYPQSLISPLRPGHFRLFVALRVSAMVFLLTIVAPERASAQASRQTPEQRFSEAYGLYADQLYEQAVQAFDAFRVDFPEHINTPEALYYQGESSLALGRDDEAVRLFSIFERTYPVHPLALQAQVALGKYFFEQGDYERATEMLEGVLAQRPPPEFGARALYLMGEAALRDGRTEEGLQLLVRSADEYPSASIAAAALFSVAYTQVQLGRYEDAAGTFERLDERYPDSEYAREIGVALADAYYELEDYPRVIAEIERRSAGLTGAAQMRAQFLLAESYNHLGDSENAIHYYRLFTEADTTNAYNRPAHYGLGWNYYREGAFEWAADEFALARSGHSDRIAEQATYYEAASRAQFNQPRDAIALWDEYLERWPEGSLAHHALYEQAVALYALNRWQEAGDALSRLIDLNPTSEMLGEALYLRGSTYIALNEFDQALRSFDRAIALNAAPESLRTAVRFQRAWLLYLAGRYAQSATAFDEFLRSGSTGDKTGEAIFWAADSRYQLAQYGTAQQGFARYLKEHPEGRQAQAALYALGWTHFKQAQYADAATYFQRFLSNYKDERATVPYRRDALLRLADSYYALKRYPEAIRAYAAAPEGTEDYALFQSGQAQANAGNAEQAIATFRRLLSAYPASDWAQEAQVKIGDLLFQAQRTDDAIAEYRQLIERYPRDPLAARAQYGIGDALYNAGRHEDAIAAYREVLEKYPTSPFAGDAAASIQFALINMGQEKRAARIIDEYRKEDGASTVVDQLRFRQAEARYQSGQIETAFQEFKEFVSTARDSPLRADAYYYMGVIQANRKQDSEAEAYLNRVIQDFQDSPRRAEAALRLADLYMTGERYQDALSMYGRAEEWAGGRAELISDARSGQSDAYIALGRPQEAERLLKDRIEGASDSPANHKALLELAQVYEAQSRTAEAEETYRQVVQQSRDASGAEALYRLGVLLLRSGDTSGAADMLARMTTLYPSFLQWHAPALLEEARAQRALGRTGEAARLFDRITSDFAGSPEAEVAARERAAL